MATKGGLGRGVTSLIPTYDVADTEDVREERVVTLPMDSVVPNPGQPRKTFSRESLEELARSIRQKGILQPLLVRKAAIPGQYELVAGERRWRAAQLADLREVPVYVREMSDDDVMLVALMENLQRENLNPAEEARALQIIKDRLSLTQEELAAKIGKSRSMVANSLRMLQLPARALESLQRGDITAGHARCLLAMVDDSRALDAFLEHTLAEKLSVRACEDVVAHWKASRTLPWDEATSAPASTAEKKERRKKTPELRALETALSTHLGCRARLAGTGDEGRLSIRYRSREELERVLAALGVSPRQAR